jgi:hypothetical protein
MVARGLNNEDILKNKQDNSYGIYNYANKQNNMEPKKA